MNITIIGLGLIGGSIAKDLREQINVSVTGVDIDPKHCELALQLDLVDRIMTLEEGVKTGDAIILTTPVNVIEKILPKVLDIAGEKVLVMDAGSTKKGICKSVENHLKREKFVASHPLAGTEYSGPQAALSGLFRGVKSIICEREKSGLEQIILAEKIWRSLGMTTYYMTPDEHDLHLAYVSHLSHVTSFALGLTVLEIEKDEKQIFNLASTGFRSTARLAKSNPQTWAPIFGENRDYIVRAITGYAQRLMDFRDAIKENNYEKMISLMKDANEINKILDK